MGDQAALQAELDPWDPAAYQNAMHLMTNQGTPSFLSSIQAEADAEDQPISNPAVVQRLSVMARQPADSPSLRPFNMLGTPAPDVGVLPQPRQTLGHSQAAEQAYANGLTAAHEQEVASMQAGYGSEFWGAREVQLGVGAQQEECLDWTAGSASTAGKAQDSDVPSVASRSFALHRQPDKQAAVPQQTTASPFPGFQLGNTHNKPKPSQLKHARHSNAAGPSDNNAGGLLSHEAASALTQSREGLQSSARHSSTAPLGSRLQPSADSTIPAHWPGLDHGPGKQLGLDNKSDLRTRQDQQVGSKLAKKSKVAATLGSTAVGEAVTSSKTKPSIAQRIRSSIFGGAAAPQQPIQVCSLLLVLW